MPVNMRGKTQGLQLDPNQLNAWFKKPAQTTAMKSAASSTAATVPSVSATLPATTETLGASSTPSATTSAKEQAPPKASSSFSAADPTAGTMWQDLRSRGKGGLASASSGQSAQGAGGANATGFTLGDDALSSTSAGLSNGGDGSASGVAGGKGGKGDAWSAAGGNPFKEIADLFKKKYVADHTKEKGAGPVDPLVTALTPPQEAVTPAIQIDDPNGGDQLYNQADQFWDDLSAQFPEQLADTERIAGRKEALAARRATEMGSSMG